MAKCRSCGQPLETVTLWGRDIGVKQCLNRKCKKYGKPV